MFLTRTMQKHDQSPTSFLGRLSYFLRPVPATREQLFEMLGRARRRDLFDENALLQEFRDSRNHMAIVVDE